MVSPLDSGDWFTPGVYDVKPSTEDEGEDAKEADVCNEIENKMNIGKCQFVWFIVTKLPHISRWPLVDLMLKIFQLFLDLILSQGSATIY